MMQESWNGRYDSDSDSSADELTIGTSGKDEDDPLPSSRIAPFEIAAPLTSNNQDDSEFLYQSSATNQQVRRRNEEHRREKEGNFGLMMLLSAVMLLSLLLYGYLETVKDQALKTADRNELFSHGTIRDNSIVKNASPTSKLEDLNPDEAAIRILCVGDSFTAGFTRLGNAGKNAEFKPYALYLEDALKKKQDADGGGGGENGVIPKVHVYHKGYPGWTSHDLMYGRTAFADHRLDHILNRYSRTNEKEEKKNVSSLLDMVIILMGANDVFQGKYVEYNVSESVIAMHQTALDQLNVPMTIALDIPWSRHYENNEALAEEATKLSKSLQTFANSELRTTFVPFPFPYQDTDEKWSEDGIHCTETGYMVLAESLAPVVQQSLQAGGLW